MSHAEGIVQQSNFHDYEVMRMADVPEINIEILPFGNFVRAGCFKWQVSMSGAISGGSVYCSSDAERAMS